MSDHI